ncbi:MAG: DNA-processing protein DprA, partial [Pseudomonadota bacterium]
MKLDAEKLAWLRLARTDTIGPITFYRLLQKYKTATHTIEVLPAIARNKPFTICSSDNALREIDALHKLGGYMIFKGDDIYPNNLAAIEDAPPVLSIIGQTKCLNQPSIAIVGSRNASLNGRKLAKHMASHLGAAGHTVTSGLARGIDTAAHEGALKTGTIAVVAGGVDVVYPRENTDLYKSICEQGAVMSACALGMQPIAQHFPKRNR